MIKKTAFFAALAMLLAHSAYAVEDRTNKWDLGANVSAAIPTDGDVDTTVYVGGTLSYGITNWLAVGAEAGWAGFDESDSGISVDEDAIPVLGDIIFRVPMEGPVQPYGIVGLGVIFWNIDSNVPNVDIDSDAAFAAKFGGGVDWFINQNWIANFELAYITSDADVTATSTITGASVSAGVDTDYWTVGGGLKYLFS
jgi:opacity protein-like surface antigen